MEIHNVQSSAVSAVGYDEERSVLEVRFPSGRIYHYFEVPQPLYEKLRAARSIGQFFNRTIRDRYRCTLVYDPKRPTVRGK
jgi:hypothetical protein